MFHLRKITFLFLCSEFTFVYKIMAQFIIYFCSYIIKNLFMKFHKAHFLDLKQIAKLLYLGFGGKHNVYFFF